MEHRDQLKAACDFINNSVFLPALQSPQLDAKTKNIVRDSAKWLSHFERMGDLQTYLERCTSASNGTKTYSTLHKAGLKSYEDILPEFRKNFQPWLSIKTTAADFQIGGKYSTFQLVIYAERYDPRSGGIFPIGKVGQHEAVVVKATLAGGPYPNRWLEHGRRLRYYLKSRKRANGTAAFDEDFVENRAIIKYPQVPVLVFVRDAPEGAFTYFGNFGSVDIKTEADGSKWFELVLRQDTEVLVRATQVEQELAKKVVAASRSSTAERKQRLAAAPKKPKKRAAITYVYERNPDVIVDVLERAKGVCECCGRPAPFSRASDDTPYLEVHHLIPLADGGDDTPENATALCPNCHRNEHHGRPKLKKD